MKFLSIAVLIGAACAAECVDDNVKAKQKLVEAAQKALDEEKDSEKKKGLEKPLEEAKTAYVIAKNMCKPGDAAPEPVDADKQLAEGNNAKAVQGLKEWMEMQIASKKVADKFDEMDKDAQAKWLEAQKAAEAIIEKRDVAEKLAAGFETMTVEAKTVYLANLLKWKEQVYKDCKAAPDSADCKHAIALRAKAIAKRATDKYWAKSLEDRGKDDAAYVQEKAAAMKELIAAAVKQPVGGAGVGRACGKNEAGIRVKCDEGHCCGYATPQATGANAVLANVIGGAKAGGKDVCDVSTNVTHKFKDLEGKDQEFKFQCIIGATSLVSSFATAAVATYMLA